MLKHKVLDAVSSNGNISYVAKRPKRGVVVEIAGEPLTPPPPSSNDALWLKSAISMLTAQSLGDRWTNVVEKWVLFERKEVNRKVEVLGSLHRPPSVRDWIQRARSTSYRPAIASVDGF